MDQEAWRATVHGVARVRHDLATKPPPTPPPILSGFPAGTSGKESASQCRRLGFNPWAGKIPWRRNWQPIPVFLPGESYGQRSLVGHGS